MQIASRFPFQKKNNDRHFIVASYKFCRFARFSTAQRENIGFAFAGRAVIRRGIYQKMDRDLGRNYVHTYRWIPRSGKYPEIRPKPRARGCGRQRHLLKTKMVASNMPYPCPALMARQMSAFSRLPSTMYSPSTDVSNFAVNRGNRNPVVGSVARAK